MRSFWFLFVASSASILSACGGGGTPTAQSVLPATAPAVAGKATRSYVLSGAAQTVDLPILSGCGGRVTLPPSGTLPAATALTVTSSLTAPVTISSVERRRPQASGSFDFLCYETFEVSNGVTFPALPGFVVDIAPRLSTAAPEQFFYAISQPAAAGITQSFRTEGPAAVTGQKLSFAPAPEPLTLSAGKPYVFAFYATVSATIAGGPHLYIFNGIPDLAPDGDNTIRIVDLAHPSLAPAIISSSATFGTSTQCCYASLAIGSSGRLYLSHFDSCPPSGLGCISVFDTLHGNAALPTIIHGGANGFPFNPSQMAVDTSGKLYTLDHYNIDVFDTTNGNATLSPFTDNTWCGSGNYCGIPRSIAAGANGLDTSPSRT